MSRNCNLTQMSRLFTSGIQ